jgi:quercetin dioxygenase-like cupin family protein
MKNRNVLLMAGLVLAAAVASAQQPAAGTHVVVAARDVVWGAAPPVLKAGAQFAVIAGDPGQPGPFVIRLKVPAGYTIAPHWHPSDENLTVISGTFAVGMGDTLDAKAAQDLAPGAFALMPAQMRHYAVARTAAVVQVHGTGPFTLNYVNPADDPRTSAK